MCMGIPMQVAHVDAGWAVVEGRGERKRVRTALINTPREGDWLLVHLDSAIEALSPARAAEVNEALDLVAAAMAGSALAQAGTDFALPSALSAEALAAMIGQR